MRKSASGMNTLSPRTMPPMMALSGNPAWRSVDFVMGASGLTTNSSTSASLPVRHLMACTSVSIVKRKMRLAVICFLLTMVSMPMLSARLM